MAKKSLRYRASIEPKFRSRRCRRCRICGRARAFMRKFQVCRICFRELASAGLIPGVTKASW